MSSVSTRPAENTTVFISFFFLRITRSKSGVDTLSGTFLDKNSLSQLCPGVCMFGPYTDFTPVCLCVCVFLLVYIDFSFLVCPCPYWTHLKVYLPLPFFSPLFCLWKWRHEKSWSGDWRTTFMFIYVYVYIVNRMCTSCMSIEPTCPCLKTQR